MEIDDFITGDEGFEAGDQSGGDFFARFTHAMASIQSGSLDMAAALHTLQAMSVYESAYFVEALAGAGSHFLRPLVGLLAVGDAQTSSFVISISAYLSADPVGSSLVVHAGVPAALSEMIETQVQMPMAALAGAVNLFGNLSSGSFEHAEALVKHGAFDTFLRTLDIVFDSDDGGERNEELDGALAHAARGFTGTSGGFLPYSLVRQMLASVSWGLQHLTGEALSDLGTVVNQVFAKDYPGVNHDDLFTFRLWERVCYFFHRDGFAAARSRPFLHVLRGISARADADRFFTPALVLQLILMLSHPLITVYSVAGCVVLRTLANLVKASEPRLRAAVLQSTQLTAYVDSLTRALLAGARLPPKLPHQLDLHQRPAFRAAAEAWMLSGELAELLRSLLETPTRAHGDTSATTADDTGTGETVQTLLRWGAAAWASAVLCSAARGNDCIQDDARNAKDNAAAFATLFFAATPADAPINPCLEAFAAADPAGARAWLAANPGAASVAHISALPESPLAAGEGPAAQERGDAA
jgi:hypothetical protein